MLGLFRVMKHICKVLCLYVLMSNSYNTHPALVYEFFSSVWKERNQEGVELLHFRLLNEDRVLTMDEFCNHFGFQNYNSQNYPIPMNKTAECWVKITGDAVCNTSKMHISHVQHPVFRFFLKWLGYCIFGRPNNHHTRSVDVNMLAQYLYPNTQSEPYLPHQMWEHFIKTAQHDTDIVCGGLITHLATLYGFVDDEVSTQCSLNYEFVCRAHDLAFDHGDDETTFYKWFIYPNSHTLIPNPAIPLHLPLRGLPHYCLPGFVPPHLNEDVEPPAEPIAIAPPSPSFGHQDQPPHTGHPSQDPPPHTYTPFEARMLEGQERILQNLQSMSLNYESVDRRLTSLDQRVGQLETDHRATIGPMYAYFDNQGYFNTMSPNVQPPPWYDPTYYYGHPGAGPSDAADQSSDN